MSVFLYFAPGHTRQVSLDDLPGLGCAHAMNATPASQAISGRTPTGEPGWLFCSGGERLAFSEDQQTWCKVPGHDCFLGFWNDSPPSPSDLARPRQIAGETRTLQDGNVWLLPRLRSFGGETGFAQSLPVHPELGEDGEWSMGEVCREYRGLSAIADRLYEAMVLSLLSENEESLEKIEPLSDTEAMRITCELFRANYFVSAPEISALHILALDDTIMDAIHIAMDWEVAMAWAKKKEAEKLLLAGAG